MPDFDVSKRYETMIAAPPAEVFTVIRNMDLGSDWLTGLLLRLRGIKKPATGWRGLDDAGFINLGETNHELLLGIAGRFWTPSGGVRHVKPEEFLGFDEPGHAKATWNFSAEEVAPGSTRLRTETRVHCTDLKARRRFRAYWTLVGPFSGLIRIRALRAIKAAAEADEAA